MRYHLSCQNDYYKKKKARDEKCWQGCGENGPLIHSWWNVDWYSHYGKQYADASKN